MKEEDLLAPCPFCGGHDASIGENHFDDETAADEGFLPIMYFVACPCGAGHGEYPGHASRILAVIGWNMRKAPVQHG